MDMCMYIDRLPYTMYVLETDKNTIGGNAKATHGVNSIGGRKYRIEEKGTKLLN